MTAALGRRTFLGRRAFLGLSATGMAFGLASCSGCPVPQAPAPGHIPGHAPGQGTAAAALEAVADVPAGPGGPYTVADVLSTPSFYVAHRGSGDNWPEHTMRAYTGSVSAGLKAFEISVWSTADGVLVCHHDASTQRMTGIDLNIARASYAAVQALKNNARAWLGPATALEPIPRLDEVLKAFATTHVIFLEDKQGTNAEAILTMLEAYPGARKHVVWKVPGTSGDHEPARRNGYTTWGYFDMAQLDTAAAFVDDLDLLGVPSGAPDDKIREFVATGKPVIAWEVHRRSERDRAAPTRCTRHDVLECPLCPAT